MGKVKPRITVQKYSKKTFEISPTSRPFYIPQKAKEGSIGYDLVCPVDFNVPAHSRVAVPLNFAINLPAGVEGKIEARSGMTLKGMVGYGTRVKRKWKWGIIPCRVITSGKQHFDCDVMPGKIDPNYTESVNVILKNNDIEFVIRAGTHIAQMSFYSTIAPFFCEVEKLTCKSRGGGFGSSGTQAPQEQSRRLIQSSNSELLDEYNRYKSQMSKDGKAFLSFSEWLKSIRQEFQNDRPKGITFEEWYETLSPERKAEVDSSFLSKLHKKS